MLHGIHQLVQIGFAVLPFGRAAAPLSLFKFVIVVPVQSDVKVSLGVFGNKQRLLQITLPVQIGSGSAC